MVVIWRLTKVTLSAWIFILFSLSSSYFTLSLFLLHLLLLEIRKYFLFIVSIRRRRRRRSESSIIGATKYSWPTFTANFHHSAQIGRQLPVPLRRSRHWLDSPEETCQPFCVGCTPNRSARDQINHNTKKRGEPCIAMFSWPSVGCCFFWCTASALKWRLQRPARNYQLWTRSTRNE